MSLWILPALALPTVALYAFWMGLDWIIEKMTGGNW